MQLSTLTQKGQTTIPAEIRAELDLRPGDKIAFEIKDHQVLIRKIQPFDLQYHQALSSTLNEWSSKEDDAAYGDL